MLPAMRSASGPGEAVDHDPAAGPARRGQPVLLRWRKRRWCCPSTACPGQSFTKKVAQVPVRSRLTRRLRQAAGAAVADGGRTVAQSALDHGVSWPVVAAVAFTAYATTVLSARGPRPPTGGTSGSVIYPAVKVCSPRSKGAPLPRSPTG